MSKMSFLWLDLMLPALWSLIVLLPPIILEMLLPHSLCPHNPPDPIDLSLLVQPCAIGSPGGYLYRPPFFSVVVGSPTEVTPAYGRTSAFPSISDPWLISSFHDPKVKVEVKSGCHPVNCSALIFSVHGILQARILEWFAISS